MLYLIAYDEERARTPSLAKRQIGAIYSARLHWAAELRQKCFTSFFHSVLSAGIVYIKARSTYRIVSQVVETEKKIWLML